MRAAALALQKTALPKSAAGQAANYTLSFWNKLTVFLKHPELKLSTNLAENAMRSIAIGRKNWLHLGSKEAGPKIAASFSVVESCRRLNIPIRKYLADVLPGLANRSIQSLAELTPHRLRHQAGKLTSQFSAKPSTVQLPGWLRPFAITQAPHGIGLAGASADITCRFPEHE